MSINTPQEIRITATARTRELQLWDAWVFAAGDATRALRAWEEAEAGDAAAAFVVYRAALDREERAATVLAERAARRTAARSRVLVGV